MSLGLWFDTNRKSKAHSSRRTGNRSGMRAQYSHEQPHLSSGRARGELRAERDDSGVCSLSTETQTASLIAATLTQLQIQCVPYVPGGPLMPLLGALAKRSCRLLLFRHEAGAGFAAEGLARASRRPAVVAVTAGPGVTNLVSAVYVAQRELTPIIVISAQVPLTAIGRHAAQELDTVRLLEPITKASVALRSDCSPSEQLLGLWREALQGRPGPVHLSVAADQWKEQCS
jgi:thiamine pyrophosphate-dependent acetolactate synthase large subunit-like protein